MMHEMKQEQRVGKEEMLKEIEAKRADKEEIEKLALYSQIKRKEKIAEIDEALLEYWK